MAAERNDGSAALWPRRPSATAATTRIFALGSDSAVTSGFIARLSSSRASATTAVSRAFSLLLEDTCFVSSEIRSLADTRTLIVLIVSTIAIGAKRANPTRWRLGSTTSNQSTFSAWRCKLAEVAISDAQFKAGVFGAAGVLVLGITLVRFCGSVSLPDKPSQVVQPTGTSQDLRDQTNGSPVVYQDFLAKDASVAGLRVPTLDDMSRKLLFRTDESRQVLEVGQDAITTAGLKLTARRQDNSIVLEIENITRSDLAYHVVTEPTPKIAGCNSVTPLAHNALVIAKGEKQTRIECSWHAGMAIAVTLAESAEVLPLSAWYLNQLPPSQVGIDDRVARGHRVPKGAERCISLSSQVVRSGLENGEIRWRDLVDFYTRHRCQTYPFPATYRALASDGQRRIPAQ